MGDEAENLLFEREHQLSHKPLEMDLLIIKMQNGIQLKKNIGKIFRKHNIIEYKSPKDYLSINDFIKCMVMLVSIRQIQKRCVKFYLRILHLL